MNLANKIKNYSLTALLGLSILGFSGCDSSETKVAEKIRTEYVSDSLLSKINNNIAYFLLSDIVYSKEGIINDVQIIPLPTGYGLSFELVHLREYGGIETYIYPYPANIKENIPAKIKFKRLNGEMITAKKVLQLFYPDYGSGLIRHYNDFVLDDIKGIIIPLPQGIQENK